MTKIKLCGLTCSCDVTVVNELKPDYVGFVFAPKSRRRLPPERAAELKRQLSPGISAVGVFVNEAPETIAVLLNQGVLDVAQLHGDEDEKYLKQLRLLTDKPIIKAFRIRDGQDVKAAENSAADYILLDSGEGGTGTAFDWKLLRQLSRPYFLAGGLTPDNVKNAVATLKPYAVDVSSGIETDGQKDSQKMRAFVHAARSAGLQDANK